jgi:bifunctional UDP-N-acetylglucosamine pyrophosphorylase/glucosamine-1-phosphate N-acetyltransferase
MRRLAVVVLAAGQGTRMKSDRAKVLHPILGRPMIWYPLATALALGAERTVVVTGAQAEQVRSALTGMGVSFAVQKEQRGTAHAVMAAMPALKGFDGDVLVLYGDGPLWRPETARDLIAIHRRRKADISLVTINLDNPYGYGRILRDGRGRVYGIVEEKDLTPEQKRLPESNPGMYAYRSDFLRLALPRVKTGNAQAEYYLTDLVEIAVAAGKKVESHTIADQAEIVGVNSRAELARASELLRERINRRHGDAGVTIESPADTIIEPEVEIGRDTTIETGARLMGVTVVEEGCTIEAGARIKDSLIGAGSTIEAGCRLDRAFIRAGVRIKQNCVLEDCEVAEGVEFGPMSRLRPGSKIGRDVKVGNFVEFKKARIGAGTKVAHLSYIGDADIGANVNVGCGFITCNYDGERKWRTVVEDDVFIGSDSQTVAPVKIGRGAYIGSGSTIAREIPPGALALTRAPLTIKEGWADKKRASKKESKKVEGPRKVKGKRSRVSG